MTLSAKEWKVEAATVKGVNSHDDRRVDEGAGGTTGGTIGGRDRETEEVEGGAEFVGRDTEGLESIDCDCIIDEWR